MISVQHAFVLICVIKFLSFHDMGYTLDCIDKYFFLIKFLIAMVICSMYVNNALICMILLRRICIDQPKLLYILMRSYDKDTLSGFLVSLSGMITFDLGHSAMKFVIICAILRNYVKTQSIVFFFTKVDLKGLV